MLVDVTADAAIGVRSKTFVANEELQLGRPSTHSFSSASVFLQPSLARAHHLVYTIFILHALQTLPTCRLRLPRAAAGVRVQGFKLVVQWGTSTILWD
jgi:hypothetical protein